MKRSTSILLAFAAAAGVAQTSFADVLVNDTWADGDRTSSSPGGDSAWFWGGAGSLTVVAPGGPMRGDLGAGGASSASWTTYFAPSGTPVTLASAGDSLKLTWQFTLSGIGAANTSQNFRLAVVNTPSASRLSGDGNPGNATYAGYGMFMNLGGTTLGNANPFRLMERTDTATASAMLSASGSWTGLANGATAGNAGYAAGTLYTYSMQLTRNGTGGLDIISRMAGGTLDGDGEAIVNYTDATPNSMSFDTFSIRPSSATGAAQIFDSSLFKVEYFPSVPEPGACSLLGLGILGFIFNRRNRR